MAKPDLVKALIAPDGSIYGEKGIAPQESRVKGATSEELSSAVLLETTNVFSVPEFPVRDNLKIVFDLTGTIYTTLGFNYAFRFNNDSGMNYITGYPVGPYSRIILGGYPGVASSGDNVRIFGSISVSNRSDSPKIGNGYMTYTRGTSIVNIACPVFSWLPVDKFATSLSVFVEDSNGTYQSSFEFDPGSRIKVLGRNY